MFDVEKDNRLISIVSRPGIRNLLVTLLDQLQRCQKSLNEFLEVRSISYVGAYICNHSYILMCLLLTDIY